MNLPNSILLDIDVSAELSNQQIGTANNINVLLVPTGVKAYVSFENTTNTSKMYPLYTNADVKLRREQAFALSQNVYLHTIGTSVEKLTVNLSVIKEDKVSCLVEKNADEVGITDDVLTRFEKAINKYENNSQDYFTSNSAAQITFINKVLTCDKITISINGGILSTGHGSTIICELSAKHFLSQKTTNDATYGGEGSSKHEQMTFENVKGQTLNITGLNSGSNIFYANIQEYTLKA